MYNAYTHASVIPLCKVSLGLPRPFTLDPFRKTESAAVNLKDRKLRGANTDISHGILSITIWDWENPSGSAAHERAVERSGCGYELTLEDRLDKRFSQLFINRAEAPSTRSENVLPSVNPHAKDLYVARSVIPAPRPSVINATRSCV